MADVDFKNSHSEEITRYEHRRKNVGAKAVTVHGYDAGTDSYFPITVVANSDGTYSLKVTDAGDDFSSTTNTNVAASATSVTLAAANSSRKELTIWNDSQATLYIKEGTTASATDFKFKLLPDDYYYTNNYTGRVDGIWSVATGTARVSES